ncbi:MAG: class I SAM-dependent methyltransferase [Sphingobacteriales bacterium]|nr:MAG: class I SAM-dependent methyltransferase [Sphingobacteriales bacterium]
MVKTLRWRVAQLFEILWWKRYLANKDVSNYLTLKKKYWNEVLEKLAESVHMTPGQHVLDAGCGPAGIFIILDGYKVTAIDPLLDTYEEKLAHFNKDMYPYVNFETTPLETFQSSERYDFVYCMNAINHVSQLKDGISLDMDFL